MEESIFKGERFQGDYEIIGKGEEGRGGMANDASLELYRWEDCTS